MSSFTSRAVELNKDIDTLYGLVSDPSRLQPLLEKYESRVKDYKVEVTEEQVSGFIPALGQLVLKRVEVLSPNLVKYETIKSPVPLSITINLSKEGEQKTLAQVSVDAKVPMFLAGMVKGKVQGALDKWADLLEKIDFDKLLG